MRPIDVDQFDSFSFDMPDGLTEKEQDIFYDGMCYVLNMIEGADECYEYGHWIPVSDYGDISKCSKCVGFVYTYDLEKVDLELHDLYPGPFIYIPKYEICPYCGAIMNDEEH